MTEINEETFYCFPVETQLQFLLEVALTVDSLWENRSERFHHIYRLQHFLSLIPNTESGKLHYVRKLLPSLSKDLPRQSFQSILTCLQRSLESSPTGIETADRETRPSHIMPLTIVLDNIRSAFNVGSIVRTAETIACKKVIFAGYTATPENEKTKQASMGCEEWIQWEWQDNQSLLEELKNTQAKIVALETAKNATSLWDAKLLFPTIVILGNERFGVSKALLQLCDDIVRIPTYGRKNSLNVANALSVFGFEARRQWNQ